MFLSLLFFHQSFYSLTKTECKGTTYSSFHVLQTLLFYVLWHIIDIYQVKKAVYFRKKYIFARILQRKMK